MQTPTPLPLTISEAQFQKVVIDTLTMLGWRWVWFRPARTNRKDGQGKDVWVTPLSGFPGSPDLLCARDGRVLFVELKRHGRRPEQHQQDWLNHLGAYGRFWTPAQWNDGTILRELRGGP